jgi:hypothetical protein
MTVLDLINLAAYDIGKKGQGKVLSAEDQQIGLACLNGLVDTLGAMRQMSYQVARAVYPIFSGQGEYEIGPNATGSHAFVQERPIDIQSWSIILTNTGNPALEMNHKDVLSDDEYAAIPLKTLTSTFPTEMYFDNASPTAKIKLWPVGTQSGNQIVLYYPTTVSQFTSLTQQIAAGKFLPPGYLECLEYGTAIRMAPKFGADTPVEVATRATLTMAAIKARNVYVPTLSMPFQKPTGYNWLTDDYPYPSSR